MRFLSIDVDILSEKSWKGDDGDGRSIAYLLQRQTTDYRKRMVDGRGGGG